MPLEERQCPYADWLAGFPRRDVRSGPPIREHLEAGFATLVINKRRRCGIPGLDGIAPVSFWGTTRRNAIP
jgi:hypothetical protein